MKRASVRLRTRGHKLIRGGKWHSRADEDEDLAENEDDQGQVGGHVVQVVVRSIFSESVSDCEQDCANRVQADQLPGFVAANTDVRGANLPHSNSWKGRGEREDTHQH